MPVISHLLGTPVGALELEASDEGLSRLVFLDRAPASRKAAPRGNEDAEVHMRAARKQLQEYFRGERKRFEVQLDLHGSDFEWQVWDLLLKIPYGKTRTYGQLARELGGVEYARAVGGAVGSNPVSIIVPCHRVIGTDGSLTGYGGGLAKKEKLLRLEGVNLDGPQLALF
ncbi:MAG TPA: methylated-DNA--[protein]-cysteine S-methyltransferase [Candidatus Saccharimonadales bacterium]|nr:methylated-DNA--[protein]-cysteine S-methyltransferase [Candidatus Saccharimonadales bacterium]